LSQEHKMQGNCFTFIIRLDFKMHIILTLVISFRRITVPSSTKTRLHKSADLHIPPVLYFHIQCVYSEEEIICK
jgi:hypothetical protein